MPTLKQIQDYINNRRKKIGDDNNIDQFKEFISSLEYVDGVTGDDELFTFGTSFGDGSGDDHFHLGLTSKKMLSRVELKGMFHIDATYKIVKYNFPLIVLGVTDINRTFHPICYMFTSHETEDDYDHFFDRLLIECDCFGFKFEPKYMCSDAAAAIANSVEKFFATERSKYFSNCILIMCYFHLRMNIKKQKGKKLPVFYYESVMNDIGDLHNTLSQSQYDSELKIILSKWKESPELNVFSDYFKKQWLNSKFSKWQLFNVPVGYAMTNSPIESYNNTIKESFTKRIKHHLKSSVEVFQDVISYESTNQKEFKINPTVKKYMRVQAKTILTNNKLIPTNNNYKNKYSD